ncbi:MAG: nucleotidyltransferase family protein [Thermoplasmata archaeon]
MISIILAAGQGTRLRPLTYAIPKVLLPVNGKVVLEYLLDNIKNVDVEHTYVVVSEHADLVTTYIKKANLENVSVIRGLGWETGGDLSIAFEEINKTDDYIVLNGDIVTDLDLAMLYEFHRNKRPYVSMSLIKFEDPELVKRFGQIEVDGEIVTKFLEKTTYRKGGYVNVGFYIFDRDFIKVRSKYMVTRKFKIEHDLFPMLAREKKLYGKLMKSGYWWDVGTLESYIEAENNLIQYFMKHKK